MNENWKAYHPKKNDFEEGENPYKFLQEGNVLLVSDGEPFGFDWSTVIVFQGEDGIATFHDCNYMLRCTTNLFVVTTDLGQ